MRHLIAAIREGDEQSVEAAVVRLSSTRRYLAPLAFLVGAVVMLFSGLKLLAHNWRLTLIQVLPAMWIWAAMFDLKLHVLRGKTFHDIRGPLVLVLLAAVIAITAASFYLNAVFGFAVSQPGDPEIRTGFEQARTHARVVLSWGAGVGVALGVASLLAPRWGLLWFAVLMSIIVAVMMVCYTTVPARIIGAKKSTASPRDKLASAAVGGAVGATICAPPYLLGRFGVVLLGSGSLFWLGVALLVVGIILYGGAQGAVKTVKVGAKLVGQGSAGSDKPATA
jgi:hypothetical protein